MLGLVFRELTDKQIARKLNLGLETVHTYMTHLHQKLHVQCRVGLVMHAVRWLLARRARPSSKEDELPSAAALDLYARVHDPAASAGGQDEDRVQIEFANLGNFLHQA